MLKQVADHLFFNTSLGMEVLRIQNALSDTLIAKVGSFIAEHTLDYDFIRTSGLALTQIAGNIAEQFDNPTITTFIKGAENFVASMPSSRGFIGEAVGGVVGLAHDIGNLDLGPEHNIEAYPIENGCEVLPGIINPDCLEMQAPTIDIDPDKFQMNINDDNNPVVLEYHDDAANTVTEEAREAFTNISKLINGKFVDVFDGSTANLNKEDTELVNYSQTNNINFTNDILAQIDQIYPENGVNSVETIFTELGAGDPHIDLSNTPFESVYISVAGSDTHFQLIDVNGDVDMSAISNAEISPIVNEDDGIFVRFGDKNEDGALLFPLERETNIIGDTDSRASNTISKETYVITFVGKDGQNYSFSLGKFDRFFEVRTPIVQVEHGVKSFGEENGESLTPITPGQPETPSQPPIDNGQPGTDGGQPDTSGGQPTTDENGPN